MGPEGGLGTIEIYEHYGKYTLDAPPPDMPPIGLQVPEKFRYGLSKGAVRNWDINILTYYPKFTSLEEPANAKFGLHCVGICNGRILILVENRIHGISMNAPTFGEFIARATLSYKRTVAVVRNIEPVYGFDEGFETIRGTREVRVERFYYKKAADRIHRDLAVECNVSKDRTTCRLYFSLTCNPRIGISVVGVDGSFLPQAVDIKDKTDSFISAMVNDPPCHQDASGQ
jgi:hypothetical protein